MSSTKSGDVNEEERARKTTIDFGISRRGMSGRFHSTLGGVGFALGGMDVREKGAVLFPFQADERDRTQQVIRKKRRIL